MLKSLVVAAAIAASGCVNRCEPPAQPLEPDPVLEYHEEQSELERLHEDRADAPPIGCAAGMACGAVADPALIVEPCPQDDGDETSRCVWIGWIHGDGVGRSFMSDGFGNHPFVVVDELGWIR